MRETVNKPKPHVDPEFCKGCGRCIDACPQHCIDLGTEVNPITGLIPIEIHDENCNSCGLCVTACPEPYGLDLYFKETEEQKVEAEHLTDDYSVVHHETFEGIEKTKASADHLYDEKIQLQAGKPLIVKGTYASAIGAIIAGCRHFYGYPITPSTEGAELMAKLLPALNGTFVQAVSEVATINMMYGTGGAGLPCMTFTSSPGFSLMLEGISYMIGAEVPGVIVNIMRGGPGLGNIAPEQADIKLVCRGLGHGNTHAIVLAPSTPQEMLNMTILSFELTFKYRNPVIIVGDGYLGQMTGKVTLPDHIIKPGLPDWSVFGDEAHRGNLIASIDISESDLEKRNERLNKKYETMISNEQRADTYMTDDADILLIAANTPAQMTKGAVSELRKMGIRAGLFRPISLWPFPINELNKILPTIQKMVVVEASAGQLEDELRLALAKHHYGQPLPPIDHVRHMGGVLPQTREIVDKVVAMEGVYQ